MSRRKQLRPFKVQDDDDNSDAKTTKGADNGISISSNGENTDELQTTNQRAFCKTENEKDGIIEQNSFEIDVKLSNDEKFAPETHQKCQDSANNNGNDQIKELDNVEKELFSEKFPKSVSPECDLEGSMKNDSNKSTHELSTLDALESTKAVIAQLAAAALSKGGDESSIKDLTMLQSALFTLQHQQVFQMQLIEQLQFQLAKKSTRDRKSTKSPHIELGKDERDRKNIDDHTLFPAEDKFTRKSEYEPMADRKDIPKPAQNHEKEKVSNRIKESSKSEFEPARCHINSSLVSNIITNHDVNSPTDETNSLQLLQKRAEEVLDSASQSFTTGNLMDELSYRTGAFFNDGPTDDPALKHRCRFCGKIFGSDSALQIHLRSHTGERPFCCKICSSRFTTKGNLKVHYQRHTESMEFVSDGKNGILRPPPDFRPQTQPVNKNLAPEKLFSEETLDSIQREKEKENIFSSETRRESSTPDTPRRFENESTRSYLSFDLEYSSSKKKAWEKYMEVVYTPKAAELQQDEAYRVDPNKCPICNRLLSCRSALRQHYRTHTGERPFKCRLCDRSFTTKGNLKTHIGVHKINPLLSTVHSCTICHKKYSTAHALQQHINTHTGAPIEMTIDQIRATEVRDFVSRDSLNDLYGSNSSLGDLNETSTRDSSLDFNELSTRDGAQHKNMENDVQNNIPAIDLSDSEDSKVDKLKRASQDFEKEIENLKNDLSFSRSPEPKRKCNDSTVDKTTKIEPRMDFFTEFPTMFGSTPVPMSSPSQILSGNLNSFLAGNTFNPVGFATGVRGNTTCNICFKTLACHSALEIHYRSHTKKKPFLCQFCTRGFSTKGNMKQHMLTHKIRDMPQHVFRNSAQSPSSDSNNSLSASGFQTQLHPTESQPAEIKTNDGTLNADCLHRQLRTSEEKDNDFEMNTKIVSAATAAVTSVDQSIPTYLSSDDSGSLSSPIQMKNGVNNLTEIQTGDEEIKNRSPLKVSNILQHQSKVPNNIEAKIHSNNETQQKMKTKESKRDYCKLCNKHFGSSSALETHIRSHTGDKPFICVICVKGFSTKGNLKVHMGTHSWTNDANRTGRLSLDMPNHYPQMNPYGLQRPRDIFNPFIANAAVIQQKLHEANLYQKYVNASNIRDFSADMLKNSDEQSLHRNLFGLAHLPFQMFNDHIDHSSMKNK